MKVLVAVCIYDRFENLKRWIHAWKMSDTGHAELVIVHNMDELKSNDFETYCRRHRVKYVKRKNIGLETGVIQDLFLDRLKVGKWDALLFCTDDTIPMSRGFILRIIPQMMRPDLGVACMHISGVWTPHIRTTGFCVKREVAMAITWVHNPIITKEQCYFFEHQGFEDTFMSQVLKMDKRVIQLSSIKESVLWDTDHNADHNRMDEWNREFPGYN